MAAAYQQHHENGENIGWQRKTVAASSNVSISAASISSAYNGNQHQ